MVSKRDEFMGPPTVAQRVELLEEKLNCLEETIRDEVTKTVEKAMEAMRHTMTEVLMEGQGMATKKMGAEFEALTGRLEGHVNRSREYHKTLINMMRNDQLKFQAEVRSTLTGIHTMQAPINDKVEASINRGDMFFPSPNSNLGINSKTIGGRDWIGEKLVGGEGFGGSSSQNGCSNSGNWRYR